MGHPELIAGILECKNFSRPDEVRIFPKGRMELLNIGGGVVGQFELEPGWRWSEHIKPTAGTELCEAAHFQYVVSGRLHGIMSDGTEFEAGPGDVLALGPGHEAWVIGDERFVAIDWTGATDYAKRSE